MFGIEDEILAALKARIAKKTIPLTRRVKTHRSVYITSKTLLPALRFLLLTHLPIKNNKNALRDY